MFNHSQLSISYIFWKGVRADFQENAFEITSAHTVTQLSPLLAFISNFGVAHDGYQ